MEESIIELALQKKKEELLNIFKEKPELKEVLLNIRNYMEKEYGEILDYKPIKTKEQFLKNYQMHDRASESILKLLINKGYLIFHLGKDLRNKRVQMKNEMPDFLLLAKGLLIGFDVKSKSKKDWFGIINERAVLGYRKFQLDVSTKKYRIPIYSQFILMKKNEPLDELGYSNLSEAYVEKKKMWDGNLTYKFNWKSGLLI